jgi:hypothetical protein
LAGGVGARVDWFTARVELCPIRVGLAGAIGAVDLRPCVGLGGGVLRTEGTGLAIEDTQVLPWGAAIVGADVSWALARARPGWGEWGIEVGLAALAPFAQERFYYAAAGGRTRLPAPSPVGAEASGGVLYWFP